MRGFRLLLLFAFLASLMAYPSDSFAAKKKQEKAFPVKVMKASDIKFKHAKVVEKQKPKRKRFLWFKKKESKLTEARMARIVQGPVRIEADLSESEELHLVPKQKKSAKAKKSKKLIETPVILDSPVQGAGE